MAQNLNPLFLQQRLKEAALHLYFIVIAFNHAFWFISPTFTIQPDWASKATDIQSQPTSVQV